MPTYEYKCPTCQKHVDIIHSFADTAKHKCENCHVPMVKVFAAPGLSFKGGGWAHKE
jgi:putative FmdB family regulatory protein